MGRHTLQYSLDLQDTFEQGIWQSCVPRLFRFLGHNNQDLG